MKKSIIAIVLIFVMCFSLTSVVFAQESISVLVNGNELSQKGLLKDGNTLIPLRALAQAMKATVKWDADTQMITLEKLLYRVDKDTDAEFIEARDICLWIGKNEISINGEKFALSVAPQLIEGVSMIPVRPICQWFEAAVAWDASTQIVNVTKGLNESFSDARYANTLQANDNQTQNKILVSAVTYTVVKWINEEWLLDYNVIFLHGDKANELGKAVGFYKYDASNEQSVGDLIYATPSFDETFAIGNSSQDTKFDGVTMQCGNGILYFRENELKTLGIVS